MRWTFNLKNGISIFLLLLFSLNAYAAKEQVSLNSFRVVKENWEYVDIEIIGSNKSSISPICLYLIASSKDGIARSAEYTPAIVASGDQVKISARVTRPRGAAEKRTEKLLINVYYCGQDADLQKITDWPHKTFDWLYIWHAISEKVSASRFNSYLDTQSTEAWWIYYSAFYDNDFSAIDILADKWNDSKERDPNGQWKLSGFSRAANSFCDTKLRDTDLKRLREWRRMSPKSPAATVAEARCWMASAWQIRGGEYANDKDVDPVAIKLFKERMQKAQQILDGSKSFASKTPLWYEASLDVAIAMNQKPRYIENLFNEGTKKYPQYYPLYLSMASYWLPKSGEKANWRKVDDLVNKATAFAYDSDGASTFARLYVDINYQQRIEVDVLESGLFTWSKMKESFEDLVARYPSYENLNMFAVFACRAGDKNTYFNLKPKITNHILPDLWRSNYSIDLCDRRFMQYS